MSIFGGTPGLKFLKILVLTLLILAATAGGAAWKIWEEFGPEKPSFLNPPSPVPAGGDSGDLTPGESAGLSLDPLRGTVNILCVGLDDVDGAYRSDAVALAAFDQDTQSVRVLSIPRDSRVFIPGRGWDKLNHAYVYGGIGLLKETVINLAGVGIDYFAILNYQSFPRMVDLIGGVDIDVEKKLVYTDYSGKLFINIPKGQQHMIGKTALEYVRFRHDPLGDIGRVQRQQKFLALVMEKLKSPSILLKIPSLAEEFVSAVNTDLTPLEGLKLMQFANSLPRERVQLSMAPGKASYIGNVSYWIIDTVEMSKWLAGERVSDALAAASQDEPAVLHRDELTALAGQIGKIAVLNGDGANGLGQKAARAFQRLGVDVAYTNNAKHFDYHASSVVYPENATKNDLMAADALAKLCGITNKSLVQKERTAAMVSIILGHDKEAIFKRLESL
jgi:LCP family protein required for cell wall assembly